MTSRSGNPAHPPLGTVTAIAVAFLLAAALPSAAQLVAAGQSLTVTTPHAVASFAGPDLVGLVNSLTGETYLRKPSTGSLASVNAIGDNSPLQPSNWSIGVEAGTGHPLATITAQNGGRSLALAVKIDPASQEIVLRLSATVATPGLRDASWSLAGLDLTAGRLIVPSNSGQVFDRAHPGIGLYLQYPNTWQAQMAVYEAAAGSVLLYSTDQTYAFKRLRLGTRGSSTIDVAVATEAVAPFPSATTVPVMRARSPTIRLVARMSPCTSPSICTTGRPWRPRARRAGSCSARAAF